MENKVCKKCQKPLPHGYKYKKCEYCRSKQAEHVKNGVKATVGIAGSLALAMVSVVSKGTIKK